jgi:prolipoprotein diacylglyceryltransferase
MKINCYQIFFILKNFKLSFKFFVMDRNLRVGIVVSCIILISVLLITKLALSDKDKGIFPELIVFLLTLLIVLHCIEARSTYIPVSANESIKNTRTNEKALIESTRKSSTTSKRRRITVTYLFIF